MFKISDLSAPLDILLNRGTDDIMDLVDGRGDGTDVDPYSKETFETVSTDISMNVNIVERTGEDDDYPVGRVYGNEIIFKLPQKIIQHFQRNHDGENDWVFSTRTLRPFLESQCVKANNSLAINGNMGKKERIIREMKNGNISIYCEMEGSNFKDKGYDITWLFTEPWWVSKIFETSLGKLNGESSIEKTSEPPQKRRKGTFTTYRDSTIVSGITDVQIEIKGDVILNNKLIMTFFKNTLKDGGDCTDYVITSEPLYDEVITPDGVTMKRPGYYLGLGSIHYIGATQDNKPIFDLGTKKKPKTSVCFSEQKSGTLDNVKLLPLLKINIYF